MKKSNWILIAVGDGVAIVGGLYWVWMSSVVEVSWCDPECVDRWPHPDTSEFLLVHAVAVFGALCLLASFHLTLISRLRLAGVGFLLTGACFVAWLVLGL
jgi:hypothetical protein